MSASRRRFSALLSEEFFLIYGRLVNIKYPSNSLSNHDEQYVSGADTVQLKRFV